jgi:hypothetical protein
MPSPDYLDGIVIKVIGELEARLADDSGRPPPFSGSGHRRNDK